MRSGRTTRSSFAEERTSRAGGILSHIGREIALHSFLLFCSGEVKAFAMLEECSMAAGVRRLMAVTGAPTMCLTSEFHSILSSVRNCMGVSICSLWCNLCHAGPEARAAYRNGDSFAAELEELKKVLFYHPNMCSMHAETSNNIEDRLYCSAYVRLNPTD